MEIMAYSVLCVLQGFYHEPYGIVSRQVFECPCGRLGSARAGLLKSSGAGDLHSLGFRGSFKGSIWGFRRLGVCGSSRLTRKYYDSSMVIVHVKGFAFLGCKVGLRLNSNGSSRGFCRGRKLRQLFNFHPWGQLSDTSEQGPSYTNGLGF